jgi:hypothetical protein
MTGEGNIFDTAEATLVDLKRKKFGKQKTMKNSRL